MIGDLPPKLWLPPKPAIVRAASLELTKLAMPIMGTFAAASVNALRPKAGGSVTLSHIASNQITTDTNTYTISSVPASAGHLLIGFVTRANANGRSVSSVTYDGNAATDLITANLQQASDSDIASWYIIAVSGATSANVVITLNNTMLRLGYTLLQATGVGSMTAYDTDIIKSGASATSTATSIDVPANGAAVSIFNNLNGGATTWSGLTEQADSALESSVHMYSSAWKNFTTAQTALSVSASHSSADERAMATASLTP